MRKGQAAPAGSRIPDPRRAVLAGGDDLPAIIAEADGEHSFVVRQRIGDGAPVRNGPDPGGIVPTGRGELPSVRTEPDVVDQVCVFYSEHGSRMPDRPEADGAIAQAGDHFVPFPIDGHGSKISALGKRPNLLQNAVGNLPYPDRSVVARSHEPRSRVAESRQDPVVGIRRGKDPAGEIEFPETAVMSAGSDDAIAAQIEVVRV